MKKLAACILILSIFMSGCVGLGMPNLRVDVSGNPVSANFFTMDGWDGNTKLGGNIYLNIN